MQTIKVVGAGFSGLVTAYYLVKDGFKVQICEQSSRAGGLIRTIHTPHGLVETAANGLLNSARLEALCADIGVPLLATRRDGRKRFIYRGKPRQLPLNVSDVFKLGVRLAASATSLRPRQFETITEWGRRVLGKGATNYLLVPALGGIYAGDPERLSASLIFGRAALPDHLRTNRPARAKVRGTVAPPQGMQQLIDGLCVYLKRAGVEFAFNCQARAEANEPTAVCLSARTAAAYLADIAPEVSQALHGIEMLSLVTATCFYSAEAARLKGFGCLFPRDQGFRARGVLFNDCIFEGRGPAHAETWIFGGALDPEVVNLSDQDLAQLIADERKRFFGHNDPVLGVQITRWPKALPHYSIDLERILTTLPPPPPNIALVGNYLGRIGLAKILERAASVAQEFRNRGSSPTVREGSL
ncbi:MAG TPA: FAD-dependent oxidoreductase [Pyrinomonadaceae bacterium]|nr:FAD-dependent oxidoreductase [Pyrinomonadaceae bacterium]